MMLLMRTTLTIDDDLAARLREKAHVEGRRFKDVVNESIRAGLERTADRPPYRIEPVDMGTINPGVDLDKALVLASDLEDAETVRKLRQGK